MKKPYAAFTILACGVVLFCGYGVNVLENLQGDNSPSPVETIASTDTTVGESRTKSAGGSTALAAGGNGTSTLSDSSKSVEGTGNAGATPSPTADTGQSSSTTSENSKTVSGSIVNTRYGLVQVQVTYSGGRITAVDAIQTPNDERKSVQLNAYAAPKLEQEVIAAQSANIANISGVTYTSEGYKQSLQAAIDQL